MSESRVLLVDEGGECRLTPAIEGRGLTVDVFSERSSVVDALDGAVASVVVRGEPDTDFVSEIRDRAGDIPVFFLAGESDSTATVTAQSSALVTEDPVTDGGADALAARIERVSEFSQWAGESDERESLYRTIVEQSHDAIFIAQDDGYKFWNQRFTELVGLDDAEIADASLLDVIHPDDRSRIADIYEQRRQGEDAPNNYDVRIVDDDGQIHACSANAQDIEYRDEYGVLVTVRDESEQHETEARFQALVEHVRDIITVISSDGTIRYESPAVERILGYGQEDLVGERVVDKVHPDDRDEIKEIIAESLRTGDDTKEPIRYRFEDADGSWRWLESVASNQTDTSVDGFVVTTRDIDDQRKREQRLERYETIIESIQQGAYVVDEDGVLQYVNDIALSRTGLPNGSLVGNHFSVACDVGLLDDDQYELLADAFDAILRGESTIERFELQLNLPTDNYVVDFAVSPITASDGSVTGAVGISTDITARKRYEERLNALHASTRQLTSATSREAVGEAVCDAAREVLDYEVSGVMLYDEDSDALVPVAFTEPAKELFGEIPPLPRGTGLSWEVFESDELRYYEEVDSNPQRFDPDTDITEELLVPIPDHGVLFVGAVDEGRLSDQRIPLARVLAANARAALDRVEREQLLRRRERELARQNEHLESFASVVSHDLQNPLSVANGYLELAQENFDGDELDRVENALDRIEDIVQDVLALARNGQTVDEVEHLSLRCVASDAWNIAAADAPEATLEFETDMHLRAHEGRLRQLFENLLANAIRHGGDDVTVRIGELDDREGFYVADDGPGIPDGDRARVFEAGYTTNPDGTGFGLNIVQSIVNAHGWSVWFFDSEEGGARFEITTEDGR
ncbi:HTR-like protein [Haloferax elongans ATCC BAA-1513]|uniref:histidine kinase n=1 Tax=Haloferax elongans ATCC BAA-1513 TaxID=1230453 RepID=M0H8X9_HALEO|nr:PAS domain S-box protein [Haloferax elongans]ELZ80930.1 HTR-like protein [Haloferax elongans ATCC BAA-1513]